MKSKEDKKKEENKKEGKEKKENENKTYRGAEAVLFFEDTKVIKERISKRYRHKAIDYKLRKERTRREFRILDKLHRKGVPCPEPLKINEEKATLVIERIKGEPLREFLKREEDNIKVIRKIAEKIADIVAKIHNAGVVHHDLTTSNFIIDENKRIFVIDFGLSFFSDKVEDKAVDIHLLERGMESKHPLIWREFMKNFLGKYKEKAKRAEEVLKRLEKVEKRGRYKSKKKDA